MIKETVIMFIPKFIRETRIYLQLRQLYIGRLIDNRLINEGKTKYLNNNPQFGSLKDFIRCVRKYHVSYDEYFQQFRFYALSESERKEYVSDAVMTHIYHSYLTDDVKRLFWNKVNTLKKFHHNISRKWLYTGESSYEDFKELISQNDVIVKPIESICGHGIFKMHRTDDELKIKELYTSLYQAEEGYVIEECIYNSISFRQFHPQSLNTLRIVTVSSSRGNVNLLGASARFGIGTNVVDNGGSDGLFAGIDINSGEIISDAYNKNGKVYKTHPDSKLQFQGFVIPRFSEMTNICIKAAKLIPEAKIIGWDIVVRDNDMIELIEANAMPDNYVLQMPLQKGNKTRLENLLS